MKYVYHYNIYIIISLAEDAITPLMSQTWRSGINTEIWFMIYGHSLKGFVIKKQINCMICSLIIMDVCVQSEIKIRVTITCNKYDSKRWKLSHSILK